MENIADLQQQYRRQRQKCVTVRETIGSGGGPRSVQGPVSTGGVNKHGSHALEAPGVWWWQMWSLGAYLLPFISASLPLQPGCRCSMSQFVCPNHNDLLVSKMCFHLFLYGSKITVNECFSLLMHDCVHFLIIDFVCCFLLQCMEIFVWQSEQCELHMWHKCKCTMFGEDRGTKCSQN